MALKWGIVTAGRISHDFVNAVSTLPKEEHQVICVAARNLKNAQEFAQLHEIPIAYDNYAAIAKNPDVEVVYIGALNPAHFELCTLFLENGKHVLCEKPLCMNAKESTKVLALAKEKRLFFMEAIWSRFFPTYQYVKQQIDAGVLGEIKEVDVEFGFDHEGSERTTKIDLGAGVILDQGVYVIQVSQWAFRDAPISIEATGVLNEEKVDMVVKGTLKYKNGGLAKILADSTKRLKNQAIIKGTKGTITLDKFWCPTSLIDVDGKEKSWPLPKAKHEFNYPHSCGLRYEAEAVRKSIRAGLLECETVTHKESLVIANIQDELRRQLGVRYPADDI